MSPRTYKMERRRAAADRTRLRILEASRELLLAPDFREFTMEAVARVADVSRLTVYYQFGSKAGLLESLYDHIAQKAHLGPRLQDVFRYGNEPLQKLRRFIEIFAFFWASDRDVIRRLHALGGVDAEVGQGLHARNDRRRNGLRVLTEHLSRDYHRHRALEPPIALDLMHMLTSFETYDALAGTGRSVGEVTMIITRIADQAIRMLRRPVSAHTDPPKVKPQQRRRRFRP